MDEQAHLEQADLARRALRKHTHAAIETAAWEQQHGGTTNIVDIYQAGDGFSVVVYGKDARRVQRHVQAALRRALPKLKFRSVR